MKNIVVVIALFGLLGFNVFAQSGNKTRPRIVKEPSPPKIKNDTSKSTKKPPVLISDEEIGRTAALAAES